MTAEERKALTVLPWVKAAIEGELREYPVTKIWLREAKQAVIDSGSRKPATDYMTDEVIEATNELNRRAVPPGSMRTTFSDPCPRTRNHHVGDPTYNKVLKMDRGLIKRMEMWVRTIEEVYDILDIEQQTIVQFYYWRRMRSSYLAGLLNVSEPTLWRIRQDIVWLIAYRLQLLRYRPVRTKSPSISEQVERNASENCVTIVVSKTMQ